MANTPTTRRTFGALFGFEAIARSGYQVGKTPVLPVFAAALGASDALLGLIVTVSACTGLLLKPVVGAASDRTGRRPWLWAAAALFVCVPFAYGLVDSPGELAAVRVVHGFATALLGPVALAAIATLSTQGLAERIGWFGMARSLAGISGPALGGWLLLRFDPATIYPWIGAASLGTVVPLLLVPPLPPGPPRPRRLDGLRLAASARPVYAAGGIEAALYVGTYALKTFLPVYAIRSGVNIGWVGLALAVQEGVAMWSRPLAGHLADRWGHPRSVALGLVGLGAALAGVVLALHTGPPTTLLGPAAAIGLSQALLLSATTAWIASTADVRDMGAALGVMGSLRNGGKVTGPLLGGLLVGAVGFPAALLLLAGLLLGAGGLGLARLRSAEDLSRSG